MWCPCARTFILWTLCWSTCRSHGPRTLSCHGEWYDDHVHLKTPIFLFAHAGSQRCRNTGPPSWYIYSSVFNDCVADGQTGNWEQRCCSVVDLCGVHRIRVWGEGGVGRYRINFTGGSYLLYTWSVFYLLIKKADKHCLENLDVNKVEYLGF